MRLVLLFAATMFLLTSCRNKQTNEEVSEGLPPIEQNAEEDALGTVDIKVTGTAEGIAAFERGLLLLHSFELSRSTQSSKSSHVHLSG